VRRTKQGLLVTWKGSASRYSILAHQSNGTDYLEVTRRRRILFRAFNPFAGGTVTVRGLGRDGAAGSGASANVKPRKPRRP
jgi:aryl-alcohol dehydrogenase-like predicted oxidoreductase